MILYLAFFYFNNIYLWQHALSIIANNNVWHQLSTHSGASSFCVVWILTHLILRTIGKAQRQTNPCYPSRHPGERAGVSYPHSYSSPGQKELQESLLLCCQNGKNIILCQKLEKTAPNNDKLFPQCSTKWGLVYLACSEAWREARGEVAQSQGSSNFHIKGHIQTPASSSLCYLPVRWCHLPP